MKLRDEYKDYVIDWLENNRNQNAFDGFPEEERDFKSLSDDELVWYGDNWVTDSLYEYGDEDYLDEWITLDDSKYGFKDYFKVEKVDSLLGIKTFREFEKEYDEKIYYADGTLNSIYETLLDEGSFYRAIDIYEFDGWFVAIWK